MASLNEIAYNIKNIAYGGGSTTGEETIGIRQIKFWIHYYRAQLILEESKRGKGVHHAFFQELVFRRKMDKRQQIDAWRIYYASNNNNQRQFIAYSPRTANLAGIADFPYEEKDFYARDFYDRHTEEVKGDYGNIFIRLPDLIHVDGYGVKNLRIRKSNYPFVHDSGFLDLPVVNYNEGKNKKYNRFTSKSPAAYIKTSIENKDELVITNLKSFNNRSANSYDSPIFYNLEGVALYSDPTQWDGAEGFVWNDDMQYPIPETLIPELNKRILVQEFNITKQTIDDRVDDNVDTTNVQQKVQRQIRQS